MISQWKSIPSPIALTLSLEVLKQGVSEIIHKISQIFSLSVLSLFCTILTCTVCTFLSFVLPCVSYIIIWYKYIIPLLNAPLSTAHFSAHTHIRAYKALTRRLACNLEEEEVRLANNQQCACSKTEPTDHMPSMTRVHYET